MTHAPLHRAALTLIATAFVALAASCSSSSKKPKKEFGPTFKDRMSSLDRVIKKSDFSQRSSFEKQMATTLDTKKKFKESTFQAKESHEGKKVASTATYKTKEFADAGKSSSTATKEYKGADEKSRMGDEKFRTQDSRMANQQSRDGSKTYAKGDQAFRTGENRAGTKAIEKNKKPKIVQEDKPTYTEDEVKRALNKS